MNKILGRLKSELTNNLDRVLFKGMSQCRSNIYSSILYIHNCLFERRQAGFV